MLLTIEDYKNNLPSNTVGDAGKFAGFEYRALYRYFVRYLGRELVDLVLSGQADPDTLKWLKPALANFTYLESIPFFNLTLTSTGYGVVSNPNIAPASMERVKSLVDACLEAANSGLFNLLAYLEGGNVALWNGASLNPGSLVPSSQVFNGAMGIHVNKVVFVELISHIREYESLTIAPILSPEFLQELILGNDAVIKPLVLRALSSGAYHHFIHKPVFNRQGNLVEMDPKYKTVADRYLNLAVQKLQAALDNYPTYQTYGYESPWDNAANTDSSFFVGGLTS